MTGYPPSFPQTLIKELEERGTLPEEDIGLADTALLMAAVNYPGLSLDRYRHHLSRLAEETSARHAALTAAGEADTLEARNETLRQVLCVANGYAGDVEKYDDLQNADLIRVIDRRKGMPISLAILYLHAARAQGWEAHGLNFPGHFVVRIDDASGHRLIVDPFSGCAVLQAADLRRFVKSALGPQAELSASFYEPAGNRAILLRLQNNIKTRLIQGEDYEGALRAVNLMKAVDPHEFRLLLDEGVLCARTNRPQEAATALEGYIAVAPHERDRHDAALLLQQIRQLLN